MKGKHTSIEKELKRNIKWVENLDGVTKVVLGISECCRHKYPPGYIKFKNFVHGGFKVNGYTGNGVIDIFIRISPQYDADDILQLISKRFAT